MDQNAMGTNEQTGDHNDPSSLPGKTTLDEEVERQGQAAMDQALAMPLVRVFFGLLVVCFVLCFLLILASEIANRKWWTLFFDVMLLLVIGGPIMTELGSVCIFGRSRTPWFRAMMRRWKGKPQR
jgi:hypothetical protein